jgi:broad specificity phosphatase PhoE
VHNPRDILYGRLPRFRLSERGHEQARAAARFLAGRPISAIYTSPLLRARQTAETLAAFHPDVRVRRDRSLIEVRTSYQGMPNSILKQGFSFYDPKPNADDETMQEIWDRMSGFLRRAARRHPGETVVAVSHGDPITILHVGLRNLEMTSKNLHSVVYAMRASITQITLQPDLTPSVSYFNVGELEETRL